MGSAMASGSSWFSQKDCVFFVSFFWWVGKLTTFTWQNGRRWSVFGKERLGGIDLVSMADGFAGPRGRLIDAGYSVTVWYSRRGF